MNTIKVRPLLVGSESATSILKENGVLFKFNNNPNFRKQSGDEFQQLILISLEDEKIKVGDLVLTTISELEIYNRIETFENRCDSIYCKKVVATQDQLSPELIQQLIDEYNNGGMRDFEIEMEEDKSNLCDCYYTKYCKSTQLAPGVKCRDIKHYKPKLNNSFVCIVKKEPILYTEEEIFTLGDKYEEYCINCFGNLPKSFSEWFNQNKKK